MGRSSVMIKLGEPGGRASTALRDTVVVDVEPIRREERRSWPDDDDDDVAHAEVIRPSAVIPEVAARDVSLRLAELDLVDGGRWSTTPTVWTLYDRVMSDDEGDEEAQIVGSIHIAYGMPTRFEITIFRVDITHRGQALGWTVDRLCDEALSLGGLTLATCPRVHLSPPPPIFRQPDGSP